MNFLLEAAIVLVGTSSTSTLQSGLAPLNYYVFEPMKKAHKNLLFAMVTDVKQAITLWLHQQSHFFYRRCIDGLVKLWDTCLNNHGAYAE
jgi:hypothetical protein